MNYDTEQQMTPQSPQSPQSDHSLMLAQLELFIRLGNIADLGPTKHFAGVLNLGNAMIEGDLALVQQALAFYEDHLELVDEHIGYLKRALAHAGVSIQEPAVLHYEGPLGRTRTAIVLAIMLERAGKVIFVSSDPSMASYVHAYIRNQKGSVTMESLHEDPQQILEQLGQVIRRPGVAGPPPFSTASLR